MNKYQDDLKEARSAWSAAWSARSAARSDIDYCIDQTIKVL